jgi:hypothetical protein
MSTPLPADTPAFPAGALALLSRLDDHSVEHVLIGELAAAVHGCDWVDDTVVIVPARFGRNIDRLSRALRELHAERRVQAATESLAVDLNPASLRGRQHWPLRTELGDLDVDFEPPATAGHLDLFDGARRYALAPGLEVEVAALEDLVRIAELRQAPRDVSALPALRAALARPASSGLASLSRSR